MNILAASTLMLLTPAILSQSSAQDERVPAFSLQATDGKTYRSTQLKGKATVLVLLSNGCPHNEKGSPQLTELARQLNPHVRVLGVVNSKIGDARTFARKLKLPFPVLADSTADLILAAGGTHSLDLILVSRDGRKLKGKWDGLSRGHVDALAKAIRLDGTPKLKLDLAKFSKTRLSGCGF